MQGKINSILDKKEEELKTLIGKYSSAGLLLGLSEIVRDYKSKSSSYMFFRDLPYNILLFISAGVANMAIRWSNPFRGKTTPTFRECRYIIDNVKTYLLLDPISFDESIKESFYQSHPALLLLRITGLQFTFNTSYWGQFARPYLIYQEIPKSMSKSEIYTTFDFEAGFREVYGVSLDDFIKIGFVAWSFSISKNFAFTRENFIWARESKINLPDEITILKAL